MGKNLKAHIYWKVINFVWNNENAMDTKGPQTGKWNQWQPMAIFCFLFIYHWYWNICPAELFALFAIFQHIFRMYIIDISLTTHWNSKLVLYTKTRWFFESAITTWPLSSQHSPDGRLNSCTSPSPSCPRSSFTYEWAHKQYKIMKKKCHWSQTKLYIFLM